MTRRYDGPARPMKTTDPRGVIHAPGPEAAAEMLCRLKADAQHLARKMDETSRQNAEAITLLASINGIMQSQTEDAERIMEQAADNTDRIVAAVGEAVAAIRDLCHALAGGPRPADPRDPEPADPRPEG